MNTFTTRAAAVDYLVAQGKPLNYAKVAIDQGYDYEVDPAFAEKLRSEGKFTHPDGLIYGWPECGEDTGDGDAVPITIDEQDVIAMYNTFEEMLSIEGNNILVDGEVMYDLEGNILPNLFPV